VRKVAGRLIQLRPTGDAPLSCHFVFKLLGAPPKAQPDQDVSSSNDLWRCPRCGRPMVLVERLTAAEIQLRSPPLFAAAA
jgi:hypothetical protein